MPLACFRCGNPASVGGLCRAHADAITRCQQLTSEQILSREAASPAAWLVDQWGATHALEATSVIGRSPSDTQITILHPSVSAVHARLERVDREWRMVDMESLNGSFHNDERAASAPLASWDRITFGDVCFYFAVSGVTGVPGAEGRGRTLRLRGDMVMPVVLALQGGQELELVARSDGGVARAGDTVIELARLEFGLLHCLIERTRRQGDPELCFMSWHELSEELAFNSRAADSENVRELVRRVRRKLKGADLPDIIESRQGVGYRLAADVKPAE